MELLKRGRRRRAARRLGRWADRSGPDARLTVAGLFADVPDHGRALDFLSRLLADRPGDAKALELLITCLTGADRPLEALAAAREAVLRCPGEAALRRSLAERAMALDLRTEALRAAEEGLALMPGHPELPRLKVEALLGLRRVAAAGQVRLDLPAHEIAALYAEHDYPERALEILQQVSGPEALRLRTEILVKADRMSEALAVEREAVESDPADPYPRAILAETLSNMEREGEALREAERALADGLDGDIAEDARDWIQRVAGDSPRWTYFTGPAGAGEKSPGARRRGPLRRFTRLSLPRRVKDGVRARFPRPALWAATRARRPDLMLDAAGTYAKRGRERATLRVLARLPRLAPEPPGIAIREARMLAELHRYGEAERVLGRLAARSPGDPAALLAIASLLSEVDRDDLATEYAAAAIAEDPSWGKAYRELIEYAEYAQQPGRTLRTARDAVTALPGDAEMWVLLARLSAPADAVQVVEEALSNFPVRRHAEILIKIATARTYLKPWPTPLAHHCLERALVLDPAGKSAMADMARLLGSLGAHREALRLLRACSPVLDDQWLAWQYREMDLPTLAGEVAGTARRLWWVPGIRVLHRYRRSYEVEVLRGWESWAADSHELDSLDGLSAFERAVVRGRYEAHILTRARRSEFRIRTETCTRRAAAALGGVLAWFAVFESVPLARTAPGGSPAVLASVAAAAGLVLHQVIRNRTGKAITPVPALLAGAVEMGVLLGPGLALLSTPAGPVPAMIGLVLLATEVVLLSRSAGVRILRLITNLRDGLDHRRQPQADTVTPLVMALDSLRQADMAPSPEQRWNVANLIEMAAKFIEADLMRPVPTRDPVTGEWATTAAREAAHALRVIKKRLLTGDGAVDHVVTELRRALRAVATGEYGRLRRMAPPRTPEEKPSWKERALSVARAVVIMGLPVLGIAVLYPIIGVTGSAYQTALLVGLGWAALYLLLALDPALREKIELARSLLGTPPKREGAEPSAANRTESKSSAAGR